MAPGLLPNGTLPNGTLPNGTLPNGTLPNGTLPNGTFPNGTRPNGTLPGRVEAFDDYSSAAGVAAVTSPRAAWGDYDHDAHDDIMFSGGLLFHNNRDGTFTDVSLAAGTRGDFSGGVWGDYNNDGHLDFYATAWRTTWDTLFRNNGDGTFTNVTVIAGNVYDDLPSEAAAWADYDLDGCLDLYVANYEWPPLDDNTDSFGTPNILWHNKCDGTFENATTAAGMVEDGRSRGVSWADYNHDGYPDLYVSNYRLEPNELWKNNGNGTFTNVAASAGVDCEGVGSTCGHSIGADFADFDNDGNLDFFVANLAHPQTIPTGADTSALYHGRGPSQYNFNDIRTAAGIGYCETASDPTWGDFDADGRPDLYVTSIYENRTNNLYLNDGALHFTDVTRQAQVGSDNGWGAGWSDYDRDGDLDLLVASSSGARLYRNPGNNNSFVEIALHGLVSNKAGIGGRVTVSWPPGINKPSQVQEMQGGEGTGSQSSMTLFFGLGDPGNAEFVNVTVEWPSGIVQTVKAALGAMLEIPEPDRNYDLGLTNLTAEPSSAIAGSQITVKATVKSQGRAPLSNAELAFYRGSISAGNEIDRLNLGSVFSEKNVSIITNAPASLGPYTIIAQLENVYPSDFNASNNQRQVVVYVRASNTPPTAALTANATTTRVNEPVSFDASGSTDDSGIVQYIFTFGDSTSANQSTPRINHSFTAAGAYTVRVTAIDENGEPSTNDAQVDIAVLPPGAAPPEAQIDSITPESPSMVGTTVSFEGSGIPHGSQITGFEWMSDQEGLLSTQPVFDTRDLRVGLHHITFRVSDSNGAWSQPANATYLIVNQGDVTIAFRGLVNGSLITGPTTVIGSASPPPGVDVLQVKWKVDGGNLLTADGLDDWSFVLEPRTYPPGEHNLTVVVTDSQGLVTSRTIYVVFGKAVVNAPNYTLVGGVLGLGFAGLLAGLLLLRRPKPSSDAAGPKRARGPPASPRRVPGPPPAPSGPPPRRMKAASTSSRPTSPPAPPAPAPPEE